MQLEYINCAICDKNDSKLLFIKNKLNYVRCKRCSLVYINPRIPIEELRKYHKEYVEKYYLSGEKINTTFSVEQKGFYRRILQDMERYRKLNRVLDIGASTGGFLIEAKNNNWQGYGVEVAEECADYAINKFNIQKKY